MFEVLACYKPKKQSRSKITTRVHQISKHNCSLVKVLCMSDNFMTSFRIFKQKIVRKFAQIINVLVKNILTLNFTLTLIFNYFSNQKMNKKISSIVKFELFNLKKCLFEFHGTSLRDCEYCDGLNNTIMRKDFKLNIKGHCSC